MSSPLVTFVIATIDRPSLQAAVQSVFDQTVLSPLVIAGDGCDPSFPREPMNWVTRLNVGPYNHESLVRNEALDYVTTPWVAYLDDDDEVDHKYAYQLQAVVNANKHIGKDPDVVIFQQTLPSHDPGDNGVKVFPDLNAPDLISWGNVGISYAVKTEWARRFPFKQTRHEDLLNLVALEAAGAEVFPWPYVGYYGRGAHLG